VKTLTLYECEICGNTYPDLSSAIKCEARGHAPQYPVGTIFGDNTKDTLYEHIVFAVRSNRADRHLNWRTHWVCRDMPDVGDGLGDDFCGDEINPLAEYQANIDQDMPAFKRLVAWLKSQGITPRIWNGSEAVLLEEGENQCPE